MELSRFKLNYLMYYQNISKFPLEENIPTFKQQISNQDDAMSLHVKYPTLRQNDNRICVHTHACV